jgi:hypothetical protein
MSLVLSRSGEDVSSFSIGKFGDTRSASVGALLFKRVFEKLTVCIKSLGGDRATEVVFSRILSNEKVEGKTEKQKNPYRKNSMSWASWLIARLGGWNGYSSESPPGPITMLRGLQKFALQLQDWLLAK